MNVKNNKRKKDSISKIQKAFISLLHEQEVKEISVSQICQITGLNRSTFYANYIDIYDLAEKTKKNLEDEFSQSFSDYDTNAQNDGALRMFRHIKENQLFYKTYFKLCQNQPQQLTVYNPRRKDKLSANSTELKYRVEFFRSGLNAMIKMWLANGCRESPEEMAGILKEEYKGR